MFVSVSCTLKYCLALNTVGNIYSWGSGDSVALGRSALTTTLARATVFPATLQLTQVMAIDFYDLTNTTNVAIDASGGIWAFGSTVSKQPSQVTLDGAARSMCNTGDFVLIQTSSWTVYSWGAPTAQFYIGRGGDAGQVRVAGRRTSSLVRCDHRVACSPEWWWVSRILPPVTWCAALDTAS